MTPRKKQSSKLIIQFLCILFLFLVFYMFINMFSKRSMTCGCGIGCSGRNISCPCYRNTVLRQSSYSNEYYQPELGGDYTSYLNKVRQNQLNFSREGFKDGGNKIPLQIQKNVPSVFDPRRNLSQTSNKNILNFLRR